jgi:hypothetical protein
MREYRLILIKGVIILIFLKSTTTIVDCEGLSLSKLTYAGKAYSFFHQPTNDILSFQINFLIQHQDQ